MKQFIIFLFCGMLTVASANSPVADITRKIYGSNLREQDTVDLVIGMRVGTNFRALQAWTLFPGVRDTMLMSGVREDMIVYYARVRGRNGEDWQYNGPDQMQYRFTPPLGDVGDRIHADRNGVNADEWVFGFPVRFGPNDTSYTITIAAPTYCHGRCENGRGTVFNFMELMEANWVDGFPEGEFRIQYGDTLIVGNMHNKVLHGPKKIKFGRVREASGSFQNGVMHGRWVFEDHRRNWSFKYVYSKGMLHGQQEQRIDGVVTRAYYANGSYDKERSSQLYKANPRKR